METPSARVVARLWASIDKQSDGCWIWTGTKNSNRRPYGRFFNGARQVLAHRYVYEMLVGPIPAGTEIDHLCRVHSCVNPRHLEAVTHTVNIRRGVSPSVAHAAKTRCPEGHEYDGVDPDGGRFCRECRNAGFRRRYAETVGNGLGKGGANSAKTHCPKGHPYDQENTYVSASGRRDCKICRRERKRKAPLPAPAAAAIQGAQPRRRSDCDTLVVEQADIFEEEEVVIAE